jgi:hypothetical protein
VPTTGETGSAWRVGNTRPLQSSTAIPGAAHPGRAPAHAGSGLGRGTFAGEGLWPRAGSGNSDHPYSGNFCHPPVGQLGARLAAESGERGDDRDAEAARDPGAASGGAQPSIRGEAGRSFRTKRPARRGLPGCQEVAFQLKQDTSVPSAKCGQACVDDREQCDGLTWSKRRAWDSDSSFPGTPDSRQLLLPVRVNYFCRSQPT